MAYSTWSVAVEGGSLGGLDYGGAGQDLLFIHTAGMSALTWDPVISQLSGFRAVSMDLRGHSLSASAPVTDAGDNWRDVLTVIDELGLNRPIVIGHNSGGFMAVAAAADSPERIRAVVTIELSLPLGSRQQVHDDLQMAQSDEFMDDLCARFGFGRVVASQDEIEEAATEQAANSSTDWLMAGAGAAIAEETRYSFVQRPDGTWLHTPDRATLQRLYEIDVDARYFPTAEMYDLIDLPLHLVQPEGGMVTLTPPEVRTLLRRRPNLHVHAIGGAHLAHRSHPGELASIIRFVAEGRYEPGG